MTPALAQRAPASTTRRERRRDGGCARGQGGRLTLDELISSAWAGVAARVPVACPWCGGRMTPTGPESGGCRSCASSLS